MAAELCSICPRKCNVDRSSNVGYCGVSDTVKVARAALHMWEEPCVSGKEGSGTVFFSGCNLRCVFCQNSVIAGGMAGTEVTVDRLAGIFLELQDKGANNINLVTPSHYVSQIAKAIRIAKCNGLGVPVVYNTGSYELADTLRQLEGLVDIYLPDLKYVDGELAARYSHAGDYFEVASKALREMYRQVATYSVKECDVTKHTDKTAACSVKECDVTKNSDKACNGIARDYGVTTDVAQTRVCRFDERGMMTHGMIVRHLILPGHTRDSKNVLKYLYDTYGDNVYISIMSQYTPLEHVKNYPEINRKVTTREYDSVVNYAIDIGINNAFIQEGSAAKESFIPEFDGEGV